MQIGLALYGAVTAAADDRLLAVVRSADGLADAMHHMQTMHGLSI